MKIYGFAAQVFLLLALLSWLGWIVIRFSGPVFTVGPDGFLLFTASCLLFAISSSLAKLAFADKKN